MANDETKEWITLSAVAAGKCRIVPGDGPEEIVLEDAVGTEHRTDRTVLRALARKALVSRQKERLVLSVLGRALLRRGLESDLLLARRQDLDVSDVETPDGRGQALVNLAESPLKQLVGRRSRTGAAFLSRKEFEAGERLRADYTRARMLPRLAANWEQPIATGRRAGSAADLSDGAIAARKRVERAIEEVGPELSGVLIDVCCFLKGLRTVEAERRWPVRSAKLMLKAALGALSRHYEPAAKPGNRPQIQSWGAEGYRPSIRS